MKLRKVSYLWVCIVLMLALRGNSAGRDTTQFRFIKDTLRNVLSLIEREYVDPVKEEDLLGGALGEMKKSGGQVPGHYRSDWKSFEEVFDGVCAGNPSLSSTMGEAAIRGMVRALKDPYSLFLDPAEWEYYRKVASGGTFAGIGVELSVRENTLIITTPLSGGPAERAGILPGDEVIKIDGADIRGEDYYEVIKRFDGPAGSPIVLTLRRGNKSIPVRVTRQNIRFEPVRARIIGKSSAVGYVKIPYFGPDTDREVKKAIEILRNKGISRLILDLRNNPGGDFNTALRTAAFFVPSGTLVNVYAKGGHMEEKRSDVPCDFSFKTAILINEGSASAAEVLACALSDNKKGILIGTRSFGKAVVQSIYSLPGQAALKLTTSRYLTPSGRDINHKGLMPAIVVKTSYPMPHIAEDPCVLKGIEYLRK